MAKRGRPKKPRNYCSTAEDVQKEKDQKEQARRKKISDGMLRYRETERTLMNALMKDKRFEALRQQEELVYELFILMLENGEHRINDTK